MVSGANNFDCIYLISNVYIIIGDNGLQP